MIQKCNKCSNQFTKKKIIKSIFLSLNYKPIECNKCGVKYYVSFRTKVLVNIGIVIPIFLIPFFFGGQNVFNISTPVYYALIYIIWSVLLIGLTPYFARYSSK